MTARPEWWQWAACLVAGAWLGAWSWLVVRLFLRRLLLRKLDREMPPIIQERRAAPAQWMPMPPEPNRPPEPEPNFDIKIGMMPPVMRGGNAYAKVQDAVRQGRPPKP